MLCRHSLNEAKISSKKKKKPNLGGIVQAALVLVYLSTKTIVYGADVTHNRYSAICPKQTFRYTGLQYKKK